MTMLIATSLSVALPRAHAQDTATLTPLYSFSGSDGVNPYAALVQGSDGSFYSTTYSGGAEGYGTVFRITSAGVLTTLHSFTGGGDGANPAAALVQSSDGSFYGTTNGGGASGDGTVFRITSAGALTTLYSFTGGHNGEYGGTALVQGSDGDFYGATNFGNTGISGDYYYGTVFRITSAGALTLLYTFSGSDGGEPSALVQGSDGNFYGTTEEGGINSDGGFTGDGTVFQITSAGALTTIHGFSGSDGANPAGALVQGSDGNFYGTTFQGGANGDGTVFRITSAGALTTLYSFTGGGDGANPNDALVQGSDGNFYGTTYGTNNLDCTVFRITSAGALTTLYSFSGSDGKNIEDALIQGSDGNFYGTSFNGGDNRDGTLFKLDLSTTFFTGQTPLSNGVYYLAFPNGNYFGYYSYLNDPAYIYHFDLGYEYVFDANDGQGGVYLYDFASSDFFYTSPNFPFPYLYDFNLQSVLYYYPDTSNTGHYTSSPRSFYDFATRQIIIK